jgi:DNA-binding transcriptional LysR family regulator
MRINPRQIEAFKNVMLTGGITPAADLMNITQPAVSRLIRDFEFSVNLRLFEREGSRLVPRAEAISLYREVERLYLGLDQIGRAADDIRTSRGSILRIGAVPTLAGSCLQDVISALIAPRTDIALVFDVESTNHIADMIMSHQYDLGFVFASPRLSGLPTELLAEATAVAAVAPNHRLAGSGFLNLNDIMNTRILLPGRKTPLRVAFDDVLNRSRLSISNAIETSMSNCCALAARGAGIAIVDPMTALEFGNDIVAIPFKPTIAIAYLAVRPPQAPRSQLGDEVVRNVHLALQTRLSTRELNAK